MRTLTRLNPGLFRSLPRRVALAGCLAALAFVPARAQGNGVITFNYTGALQTYTVPTGTSQLVFDLSGASGGTTQLWGGSLSPGGNGATVRGRLPVVPGDVITVVVGGAGTTSSGGYGGGGIGGNGYAGRGGGGGGATTIRRNGTVVLTAGGGGGSGSIAGFSNSFGGSGGAAGLNGSAGIWGGNFNSQSSIANAGAGGTQTAGGAGGQGVRAGVYGDAELGGPGNNYLNNGGGGGGGGGGYFGGGGGAAGVDVGTGGGGGGGGSSYTAPDVTGVTVIGGNRSGNGIATLTAVPEGVSNVAATTGDGKVTLTWSPPSNTAIVSNYTITATNINAPATYQQVVINGPQLGTTATFAGLTNGQVYVFTVTVIAGTQSSNPASVSATPAVPVDYLAQAQAQIQSLQTQVASLSADKTALQGQVSTLSTQNTDLQQQVAALGADKTALQGQVTSLTADKIALQGQVSALNADKAALQGQVTQLQADLAQLNSLLAAANANIQQLQATITAQQNTITSLSSSLGSAFSDPTFTIPGATPQQQITNLSTAIGKLNYGQQQALYKNLGGKK